MAEKLAIQAWIFIRISSGDIFPLHFQVIRDMMTLCEQEKERWNSGRF